VSKLGKDLKEQTERERERKNKERERENARTALHEIERVVLKLILVRAA